MAVTGLDLQQAPPISVPLRFFVTAPGFALLAAIVTVWQGAGVFQSRWAPATLAVTHLLALGCATMIMVGALMQIMPVLAGAPFARPRAIASVVHATLTAGTLALACAFLHGERALFAGDRRNVHQCFTGLRRARHSGSFRPDGADCPRGVRWLLVQRKARRCLGEAVRYSRND